MSIRVLSIALLAVTLSASGVRSEEPQLRLTPELSLGKTLDGEEVTLGSLGDRPVLALFWATWCKGCTEELATAEALHRKFGDRVTIIAVSGDKIRSDLTRFMRRNTKNLTLRVTRDPARRAERSFAARGIPLSVLIDRSGAVRWQHLGFDEKTWLKELAPTLSAVMNEPNPLVPGSTGEPAIEVGAQ